MDYGVFIIIIEKKKRISNWYVVTWAPLFRYIYSLIEWIEITFFNLYSNWNQVFFSSLYKTPTDVTWLLWVVELTLLLLTHMGEWDVIKNITTQKRWWISYLILIRFLIESFEYFVYFQCRMRDDQRIRIYKTFLFIRLTSSSGCVQREWLTIIYKQCVECVRSSIVYDRMSIVYSSRNFISLIENEMKRKIRNQHKLSNNSIFQLIQANVGKNKYSTRQKKKCCSRLIQLWCII